MQPKLLKTNSEYKAILKEHWNVDIERDALVGQYLPSEKGNYGFLVNCTNIQGKTLQYPGQRVPLRVIVLGATARGLTVGARYMFRVEFDETERRDEKNPFLLVTQRNSVHEIRDSRSSGLRKIDSPEKGKTVKSADLETVVRDIFNEKLNQNNPFNVIDIAEAVDALATDIYSENKRFIYELIQNADDAAIQTSSELEIEIKSGFVVVSHNGKPFDERDLRGLCGIGRGTKRDDDAKTGYKGIGFKSVFGQRDGLVYVASDELLFRFDRKYILQNGWNQKWGNKKDWEIRNKTKFRSPWQLIPLLSSSSNCTEVDALLKSDRFSVKTAIKVRSENELANDIKHLFSDARFLLFLRRIDKVTFRYDGKNLCIRKATHGANTNVLSLYRDDVNISNWYVRRGYFNIPEEVKKELRGDVKSPKKLQEIDKAELSFAFNLDPSLKSVNLLPAGESCIFTYLPTSVTEFGFPFLVNSNFLVDAGREKLHKDRVWNKWLFKAIGHELIRCCKEFAQSESLKQDFLNILVRNYLPETDELKKSFNEGLRLALSTIAFIPNRKNELVRLDEIVIDEVSLIDLEITSLKSLAIYLREAGTSAPVLEENLLSSFPGCEKLKAYGAKVFSKEELKGFLQSQAFADAHTLKRNYDLLKYLKVFEENDPSGEWNYIIKNYPFIFSEGKYLEKIPLVCFPGPVFMTEFGSQNTLINKEVYEKLSSDIQVVNWLRKLGVKEPSELAYLEKEIIGKIDSAINGENYLQVTEFIIDLHLKQKLQETHYSDLQDLPVKTNTGFDKAKECFLPRDFRPVIDFSNYLSGLKTVCTSYIGKYRPFEWKSFFTSINVSDDIGLIPNYRISCTELNTLYVDEAITFAKPGHTYPHLVKRTHPSGSSVSFYLTYFTFLTETTKLKYAQIFWQRLISKYEAAFIGKDNQSQSYGTARPVSTYSLNDNKLLSIDLMGWGYYDFNRTFVPSFFFWFLDNVKCIPTNQQTCLKPSEVFSNSPKHKELGGQYIPIIGIESEVTKEWAQLLGLKTKFALTDYLHIIAAISTDITEKGPIKRDNIKKLGLLYQELASLISEISISEEKEIKTWAVKTKFVCRDLVPRKSSDILWIKIEGFEEQENIPAILIPSNLTLSDEVERLFQLFGIQIIDNCSYKVEGEKKDNQLTKKVLSFLPALALLLKSRLRIKNEVDYLKQVLKMLDQAAFMSCFDIQLLLIYDGKEIKGANIKYYISEKGLFFTGSWNNALNRFNISKYIALFLKAQGFEREIQLLLELSESHVKEYLDSINLSLDELKSTEVYSKIMQLISDLSGKPQQDPTQPKHSGENPIQDNASASKSGSEDNDELIKGKERLLSEQEVSELKNLLNADLTEEQLHDENLVAHIKALFYYQMQGFDVSKARVNFKQNLAYKFLSPVIDPEGSEITVMCRSARKGLLYLGAYAWLQLQETNTELYILTGTDYSKCKICYNPKDLSDEKASYWVLRREVDEDFSNLGSILSADNNMRKLQLIYRVSENEYKSIFESFLSNEPPVRSGGVNDDDR